MFIPRGVTQKVVKRVVDCKHNRLFSFIEFRPRLENARYIIPFETEYGLKLPLRKERALYGCSQTLSNNLAFSLIQIR